jgi:hypothetical protein
MLVIGISFCSGQLGAPIDRPWSYSGAWNDYTFSFLGTNNMINPDRNDGMLLGLYQKSIDTSGMDANATRLANNYSGYLNSAVEQRVKCGVFFRFDNDNNVNIDTVLMGKARDKLHGEADAQFLYSNPDCAELVGLDGVKVTIENSDNTTETSYEIRDVGEAKVAISPSAMFAYEKLMAYVNLDYFTRDGNSSITSWPSDFASISVGYYVSLFDSMQACSAYTAQYNSATEQLLELYDYSGGKAKGNMTRLGDIYGNMSYMGFCSRNYTGIGSQLCRDLEAEVSANSTSHYARADEYDGALRNAVGVMPTNLTYAIDGIGQMWAFIGSNGGAEAEYSQKMSAFNKSLADTEQMVTSNMGVLGGLTQELEKQKIDSITEIYIPEGPVSSSVGTLSTSSARYRQEKAQAEAEVARLDALGKDRQQGWAVEQYQGYIALNSMISEAATSATETLYYAQATVNYTRSQAVSIADSKMAQGYNVSYIRQKIADGDSKTTLGEKFIDYKDAYLAALALAGPESSQNETEQLAKLKAEVQSMLANAKADGINVASEQAEFDTYKDSANMRLAIEHMNNIKQEIMDKAESMYSDLPGMRARLIRYFEADRNGVLDSIRSDVDAAEAGLIAGSSIDFGTALGHLGSLRAAYAKAESDIEAMLGTYLEASIVPEVEYAPPVVDLNGMSSVSGTIKIENPLSEEVSSVSISFQPPLTIEPNEISGISATKSGKTLSFTVYNLEPLEIRTYEFRKEGIFAKGTLESTQIDGMDGTAYTTETWLVEVSVPLDGIDMGKYDSVTFNGAKYQGGEVTKHVPEGTYEANAQKSKSGAYTVSESQTTEDTPQSTVIHRAIHVSASVYLDTITLRKETACSVESSTYAYSQTSSQAIIQKVRGVGDVLMDCIYPKNVVHDTIVNLMDSIGRMNLSEYERQRLDNITIMLNAGQNSTALSELLSLNRTVSTRIDAERKANATLSKQLSLLDAEIFSLNESVALSESLGHSSDLVSLYRTRLASLVSLKARVNAAGAAGAAALLSGYNAQWSETETSKWLSQAFTNFTKVEKSYNDNGMDDPSISANMSLFRQSYISAKGAEGNLTQAVYTSYYLDSVSGAVLSALVGKETSLALLNASLDSALSALESNLTAYESIYSDAKQYKVESYLPYAPSYFSSEITKMRKAATERQMRQYLNQSASLATLMSSGVGGIAKVAENELSTASMLLSQSKAKLDSDTASKMESLLKDAEDALGLQKYGSAISAAKGVSAGIAAFIKQKEENDTRLLAIGLLIVGSLAVIAYSYREPIMGLFGSRRGKIALRKLRKGGEGGEGQE